MKFFLQILLIILLIVGLFFLLGFIVAEQRTLSQIEVKAPRALCWDVFQDEDLMSEWMDGVERIDLIQGTKGSIGSKQKITMKSSSGSDKLSQLVRTITKNSSPSSYSYEYTNAILDGTTEVSFNISDSTTIIRNEDVFTAKELWMRSTLFLMKSSINKRTQNQFDKLKTIIESKYQAQLSTETSTDTTSASKIINIEN